MMENKNVTLFWVVVCWVDTEVTLSEGFTFIVRG